MLNVLITLRMIPQHTEYTELHVQYTEPLFLTRNSNSRDCTVLTLGFIVKFLYTVNAPYRKASPSLVTQPSTNCRELKTILY